MSFHLRSNVQEGVGIVSLPTVGANKKKQDLNNNNSNNNNKSQSNNENDDNNNNNNNNNTSNSNIKNNEINYIKTINCALPDDIRVLSWTPVPLDFDAR